MTTFNPDDPRLTAYALGELTAADRSAVEQQIGNSVETLLEIEAIREVAGQLRAALQSEPALPLTDFVVPARIAPPREGTTNVGVAPDAFSPRHRWSSRIAVAASSVALLGTFSWLAWSGRNDNRLGVEQQLVMNRQHARRYIGAGIIDDVMDGEGVVYESLASDMDSILDKPTDGLTSLYAISEAAPQVDGYNVGLAQRSLSLARQRGLERLKETDSKGSVERYYRVPNQPEDWYDYRKASQRQSRDSLHLSFGVGVEAKQLPPIELSKQEPEVGKAQAEGRKKYALVELKDKMLREGVIPSSLRPQLLERESAEAYSAIHDNPFAMPVQEPLSTFSIDVDTAAYSNMRRLLTQGSWPPADAVRIEELVNYFNYDYAPPNEVGIRNAEGGTEDKTFRTPNSPFRVHLEVAGCPWNAEHRLVRVGLKGKEIALDKRPFSNIVFLIDVSGSMNEPNKLPLVKAGLKRLVDQFTENDRVGIVVYAGASGLVLDSTNASQKDVILSSIENLQAGGSTNGGEGIQLAYSLARKHFIEKGTNRVILCTDGDFNVGITNQDDLTRLIEEESKSGVFLSVLGFGMGNLKDSTLEKLADKGNGNYSYIDTLREANKVFVEQMTGTLITIAKDVKIQIEFNPALVGAYRLIGYENRMLAAQDFHDDTKDAGEIGAGHTVTALYEIIPPSKLPAQPKEPAAEEKLKYQPNVKSPSAVKSSQPENLKFQISDSKSQSRELLTIKLRYKQPDADKSSLIEMPLNDEGRSFAQASTDFRFAASVASFGMILRHSPHRGNATLDAVAEIAQSALGADKSGYRSEFVGLVRSAKALQK